MSFAPPLTIALAPVVATAVLLFQPRSGHGNFPTTLNIVSIIEMRIGILHIVVSYLVLLISQGNV